MTREDDRRLFGMGRSTRIQDSEHTQSPGVKIGADFGFMDKVISATRRRGSIFAELRIFAQLPGAGSSFRQRRDDVRVVLCRHQHSARRHAGDGTHDRGRAGGRRERLGGQDAPQQANAHKPRPPDDYTRRSEVRRTDNGHIRNATWTGPEGQRGARTDVTPRSETGYARSRTNTGPKGGTATREVNAIRDAESGTWTKDVTVERTPPPAPLADDGRSPRRTPTVWDGSGMRRSQVRMPAYGQR